MSMIRASLPLITALVVAGLGVQARGDLQLEIASLELRPDATYAYGAGPVEWDGVGGSFTIDLMVRAHVGDVGAIGLTTFDGLLADDGSGVFAPDVLQSPADTGDWLDIPGDDFRGRTGLTPDYRATVGFDNQNPANGRITSDTWEFLPLSVAAAGITDAAAGFDDIYRFNWSTTDMRPRTVVLTLTASGYGYQSDEGLAIGTTVSSGTFVINIVPAPGAGISVIFGGLLGLRRRRSARTARHDSSTGSGLR